ncbi:unnamed protein product [Acanthoscelides obtectus]|uniref:Uncharacterized protein n=3 Tax=Acanthoscelides obtectus TaxID=200917 RepID=A0A9P0KJ75_ACAOB|nr:unnamed protein product [Acanthoscelides obtectus]CAK1664247.1 hypothetical protein AOBTE_LOCUS24152 [Acanthoscelides obtectus]
MAIRPSNSSMASYMSYRKNVQDRMSEISNNVSQMIIESCTSIDNICNKVRECLTDMHFNTVKINSISEISQYGRMNKVQSNYDMDACMVSEKNYAKGYEDNRKSQSEVSVIESVHDDVSKSLNRSDQITLTPFFTIIQEVVPATLQKTDSKRQMLKTKNKLSLAKLTRQMNKKSGILDAFKSALMSNADIDEYEVLDKVVEDMNEEIRRLSTTLLDMKKLTATKVIIDTKKVNNNNMPENEQRLAIPAVLASEEKSKEESEKHAVSSSFAAVPYVESNNSLTEAIPEAETTKLSESIAQLVPDVYRRPAVTDLHIKLLVQIEANDSYICFQRLMNRDLRGKLHRRKSQIRQLLMTEGQITRPRLDTGPPPLPTQKTVSNSSCISTKTAHYVNDLKKKYDGSLWFAEKQILKKPHEKKLHKAKKHAGFASSQASIGNSVINFVSKVKLSKTGLLLSDRSKTSVKRCHTAASKPRSVERATDLKKTKSLMSKSSLDPGIASKHQVRVINDAPASPSTKYKMQCMKARTMLSPNRHLGHVDILDDLTEKDLLPLQSEYPRRDNMTEKVESRDVEDTYLYKILHSKYNSKATWSHLIEPWVECSEEKCQVCSSANEKRGGNKPKTGVGELLPPVYDRCIMTKEQMVKKLLPYMIDPSNTAAAASNFRTVTVLPVQVVYDKHQVPVVNAEQPTKMASTKPAGAPTKLPLLPMKESRMHSVRGTWAAPTQQSPTQHHPRPMKVVYDGLPNKPLELLTPAPKPETPLDAMNMSISLTSKIYSNSARCKDEKKSLTGARQKTSRSFSPRGFSNYCTAYDSSSAMKRNSPISGRNDTKQKQEKSPTKVLQSKKLPYMPDRRHQRNFIYGKTVQQQLVSFVERQTEVYSVPRPKYAEPVIKNQAVVVAQPPPTNQNATNSVSIPVPTVTVPSPKNQLTPTPKNLPITHEDRPKSVPSLRHNLMLAQLRGLKDKNDTIQSNIQKAINVIETKMVHILSTPADSSSVEAFDDMEKEITNVLSMMKNQALGDAEKTSNKRKRGTGNNPDKIEEEFTTISDELFKKLDQILDSEISRCSSTTERTDRQEHVGTNNKKTNKNNLLSSSITTSVEEITDGTRHMKPHKKSEKSRKFSAMSVKSSPRLEVTAGCSGDQQKEITSDFGTTVKQETPEENKKQSTSEDTNSNGDFVDGINANAIRDFENVDRSATTESNKDVLDSEPKTEDILSLNNAEMDLLASIEREQPKAETPKQIAEEILPEPETSKQIAENILLNLLDAPYIRDIPKVLYEISNATSHIPEHDDPKPVKREAAQEAETDKTQEEPKHVDQRNTISELEDQIEISVDPETITSALKTENENETLESFSDNVNKIIQRVEDIYSQLDDIQNADVSSIDEPKFFSPEELADVPRFKDESPSVPKIDSKEFLTPFMKGVKEKRTNLESPTNIERSPSLYNVLTFLDTLTSMKIDKTGE